MTYADKHYRWITRPLWIRITFLWLVIYPVALILVLVCMPFAMPFYMAKEAWDDTKKEIERGHPLPKGGQLCLS